MPSKRRKISAFVKILLALFLVCGALVAGGYYVLTTVEPLDTVEEAPDPACRLDLAQGEYVLEPEQAVNAATVGGVAFSRDLPEEAVTVAYATVWQESTFYNLEFGDRDSVGLFQQRPSQDWGDPEQILDPVYASGAFYDALADIGGWEELPVFEAAQAVQRSADGYAYDQHETLSKDMAEAFTGALGPAMTCWHDTANLASTQTADVTGAEAEMARVFGTDPAELPVAEDPSTGDLGWAMALWAVAHAEEYGLTSVTYGDQRWRASDGLDDAEAWTTVDDGTDTEGRVVLD